MKKKIPELLVRFKKLKEMGGFSNEENRKTITDPKERALIQRLIDLGDNDFHSLNGIAGV
jgi:hypothetical protein